MKCHLKLHIDITLHYIFSKQPIHNRNDCRWLYCEYYIINVMCTVNIRGHEANFYEAEARCHEAEIEAEARNSEIEAEAEAE